MQVSHLLYVNQEKVSPYLKAIYTIKNLII
jgi:hypothetical protein